MQTSNVIRTMLAYRRLLSASGVFYIRRHLSLKLMSAVASGTNGVSALRNELVETFLNLEKLDVNLFRAHHLMGRSVQQSSSTNFVYGGQVIGQALVAASETVPEIYHPHSLHCYFIKAGDVQQPILYSVDRVRDGRSFCTRFVKAIQQGVTILSCELSFHKEEPDSVTYQSVMPTTKLPEELLDARDVLKQRLDSDALSADQRAILRRQLVNLPTTFDVKPVDPDAYLRVKATEPRMSFWVKSNGFIGENARLNHCVAAYISDSSMLGTALLPHINTGFQIGMLFSLDHSIWFHRFQFRIDDWMLYETESPIAAATRTLTYGKLWTRDGVLVISTAQEGLVRSKL